MRAGAVLALRRASNSYFSLQVFLLRGVAWEDFLPRHHRELQRRIAVENEGDFWRSVVLAGDVWKNLPQ